MITLFCWIFRSQTLKVCAKSFIRHKVYGAKSDERYVLKKLSRSLFLPRYTNQRVRHQSGNERHCIFPCSLDGSDSVSSQKDLWTFKRCGH